MIRFFTFLLGVLLVIAPLTGAQAKQGCCSHHQGVASCNYNNESVCKDGSVSHCPCNDSKPMGATKNTTSTKKTDATPANEKPNKSSDSNTAKSSATTNDNMSGCCRGHGGVTKKCDKKTGNVVCKDKSISPGCACQKN